MFAANAGLTNSGPATVLVVDDEPRVRDLLSRWLTDAGYRCLQAANGAQALEQMRAHEIQLTTLDVTMPGQSGLEVLGEIKTMSPDTEALMLTASADSATAIAALTKGARGYLIKPIERHDLIYQAANALEHRRLMLENRRYTRNLEDVVRQQTIAIRRAHEETIYRLLTVAMYRDEETGAHIRRTGLFSALLAKAIGWTSNDVEMIRMAAPMHDVGKVGIPDAILCKPGRLTREEYAVMKGHTSIGAQMLANAEPPMLQMARDIALCHHERWDGLGYPHGLAGESIPECARIVSIADVYDALTHDRVYRAALPEDQVLAVMNEGRGTQFDPVLLTEFLSLLPELEQVGRENPDELIAPRVRSAGFNPGTPPVQVGATPPEPLLLAGGSAEIALRG